MKIKTLLNLLDTIVLACALAWVLEKNDVEYVPVAVFFFVGVYHELKSVTRHRD